MLMERPWRSERLLALVKDSTKARRFSTMVSGSIRERCHSCSYNLLSWVIIQTELRYKTSHTNASPYAVVIGVALRRITKPEVTLSSAATTPARLPMNQLKKEIGTR